jgi:tripartite-type tricarboxylate transporter receptor subunit TctC
MPKDIVNKINRAVQMVVATPDVQARFRRDGIITQAMNAEEFTRFVAAENIRWKSLIERVGLVGRQH